MNQTFSNILKVFALLLLSINSYAQKFEWVNFFGGDSYQLPVSMSVDRSGNQYATFTFLNEFKFDSKTIHYSTKLQRGLVLKQDSKGKILWYKVITSIDSTAGNYPLASMFNTKGNLLVFVACTTHLKIGADTIRRKGSANYAFFVIEFNDTGRVINSKHLIEGNLHAGNFTPSRSSNPISTDKNDNTYLNLLYTGQVTVYDSSGNITLGTTSSPLRNISFKFSNSGRNYKWAIMLSNEIQINSLKADIKGNLYAVAYWAGSTPFYFNGKTINNPQKISGIVLVWDKNGSDKNWFYIEASAKNSTIYDIAVHDSNSVFISGMYQGDSAKFDNIWKRNKKFGCYYFFALYDAKGNLKWVKIEDSTYSNTFRPLRQYCSMTNYMNEFFYFSFNIQDRNSKPIAFDGQKYTSTSVSTGFNLKVDNRGNILWGYRTFYAFVDMGTDDYGSFYFQSWWGSDSIKLGGFKSYTTLSDCFIGKTYDYGIYRGYVKLGPYCSGDSIFIPYTKTGEYADTNIFFAELSDEFGNFTGKEREIGRIKSKNDGTIRGVLPMFKVASSGNYRIRIRSTSPQAQSFYKVDTLRLLIYSRDKANPGPPEWVCRGDTIQLSTYGGTKWTWSPAWRMDNASKRQPLAWPDKDTVYKIIIADSSGCGAPDTAYKQIYIRENLKAIIAFTDTSLCENINLKIPIHFVGGDSNYHWIWYSVTPFKPWTAIGQCQLKQDDNLSFKTLLDSTNTAQKLALVLWDECSSKHDTVFVTLILRKPELIMSKFKDTTVCNGAPLNFQAVTNASSGTWQWQWKDISSNTVLSTFDFLKFKASQTTKIKLSLISQCNIDTSLFTIFVKPSLKASIHIDNSFLNDTSICFGQSLKLNALGKFGDSTAYQFKWYLDKNLVSTSNTLTINSPSSFKASGEQKVLKLVLYDNCPAWDSVSKTITVFPAPRADFSFGKACNLTPIQFSFTGSIPGSPVTTAFNWNFNGENTSTLQNPSKLYSTTGSKLTILTLSSSNGCEEQIVKNIDVKPQSKAAFTTSDICETDSAVFINKSKDATGYTWKFGDGQTISTNPTISTQKHKYQITSSTTFNVTLVALVNNGCSDSIVNPITINENPKSDFTYTTATDGKVDFKATQTNASKYRWLFGNGDSAIVTNPNYSYTYKKSSLYTVCLKVINTASCQAQTCTQLSITVGISSLDKSSGLKIYPNPNSGNFSVEIENPAGDALIEVYNSVGEKVKMVEIVGKVNIIELGVASGIYLVRVKNGAEVWNKKVLVSIDDDIKR